MTAVTATWDPGTLEVTVRVSPDPGTDVVWDRTDPSGYQRRWPYRKGPVLVDTTAPLGVPLTYNATTAGWSGSTAPLTLDVDGARLTRPMAAGSPAVPVVVASQTDSEWTSNSTVLDILGKDAPLVIVGGGIYRQGVLRLRLVGQAERAEVLKLLATGEPLMLRTGCREAVDDVFMAPLSWSEEPASPGRPAGPRYLDIRYKAVRDDVVQLGED